MASVLIIGVLCAGEVDRYLLSLIRLVLSLSLGETSLEPLNRLATLLVEQVFVGERDSDSGEETDASRYEDPDEGV